MAHDWKTSCVGALEKRFSDQLPTNTGLQTVESMQILEQSKQCLVSVSQHRFKEIIKVLTDTWKRVEQTKETAEKLPSGENNYKTSLIIVMQTLELCLFRAPPNPRQDNDTQIVNTLLPQILQLLNAPNDPTMQSCQELRHQSERVLYALSHAHFKAIFSRVSRRMQTLQSSSEDSPDISDINLLQHLDIDLSRLLMVMSAVVSHHNVAQMKKSLCLALAVNLEKVIWNWMEKHHDEFASLISKPNDDLSALCDRLFEIFNTFAEGSQRKKSAVWPLLIMLLVIAPKFLEEITHTESGTLSSAQHVKKKQFVDELRKAVNPQNYKLALMEGAVTACVRMCKAFTYVKSTESSSVLLTLVKSVVLDLKAVLFNPSKPFKTSSPKEDIELMIDCFVSFYRTTPHCYEVLKVVLSICLNQSAPTQYHFLLVRGLLKIINQKKISWWPKIDMVYSEGPQLRKMFSDTMQSVTMTMNPSRVSLPQAAIMQKVGLKPKEKAEDTISPKQLLSEIVKLINADPFLMLSSPSDSTSNDRHKAAYDLINHLVTLVTTMLDLSSEAMEALLRIHQPEVIEIWNKDDSRDVTIQTFWDINSRVLYNISQKLILHQLTNYTEILKWLREILSCRNKFLNRHKDMANVGSSNKVCKQAHIKLEVVLFMYLWSIEIESVLTAMSCFEFLCEEADILYCGDEQVIHLHLPNYAVYQEIASAYKDLTTGRAALQKKIMPMLRKIGEPTDGNKQAWNTTFTKIWKKSTDFLQHFPHKVDGGMTMKKRAHTQNEHELDDQLHEWVNMTGFLLALGSVCLVKSERSSDTQYCPVTEFISHLLKLLVCNNDKFGPQIQTHVKDLVANELNPAIYPILFEQIKLDVDKFFEDVNSQVIVNEVNTQYIENVIFIMKVIMVQYKSDEGGEHLGQTTIEPLMLSIVRYVRYLGDEPDDIKIKTKLCNLVKVMMSRRDDLTFRQEMKFRNKLVEYLTEWIMGNNMMLNNPTPGRAAESRAVECAVQSLDLASMEAVAALLKALPLQPEESDRGDLMEAKSNLFQKYFTLFMKLLNACSEELDGKEKGPATGLRYCTVQAMSNLLSANIDSGLMHSISLGYHKDVQTRAAFMEVLTKILQQGTEFETLAETALADRYDRLVELVTMIGDKGELPIAMALANVVDNQHLDELARVLVTLFDAKHLLYQLLGNMFNREVEGDCMQTLFRGNGLSSKIMSFCFKLYGQQYLRVLFTPHLEKMFENDAKGVKYEVDPRRLEGNPGDLEGILTENRKNLLILTQSVFDSIVNSANSFPPQLKNMLFYLSQVATTRFPADSIFAVGTVVFLRFINPALVSAHESGLCDCEPTLNMKRGITLICKIMQNIANRVETEKESYMKYFNDFFKTNFDAGFKFFRAIATEVDDSETSSQLVSYYSDSTSVALHRLLWVYEEKIGEFLASSRDQKAAGRRPFDKMATLLAYLGPPEHRPADSEWGSMYMDMSGTSFEELMSKQNMHEKEEYKSLKSLMIFYQNGFSRHGNPVFYYIARRFKQVEINGDLLMYHVLLTLKPYFHKSYDLVIDFTHTSRGNTFKTHFLNHWFYVIPDMAYRNINQVYIYNCSSTVKAYTKFHDRQFFSLKNNPKLIFIDQRVQLNQYIDPEQQKLPGSTLSLEEDQRVFANGLSITNKDTKCSIKIGQSAIQISSNDKSKVLGHQVLLNDVYYVAEIIEVNLVEDNQFTIAVSSETNLLSFMHADSETIVASLNHIKHRYQLMQPDSYTPHTKIKPKDVPGTLLNVALLNLGSSDPSLRSAAYNLLCVLTQTFDLKIEDQLLETAGLCIPSNNTLFIKHISKKLAANVTRLTLEFLEECIQGCRNLSIEMKHLCLEYMTPWLPNLTMFCKHQDENKRQKVMLILDKLITMTIEEVLMYPSVQAKIWGNIGQVADLIDMVLDSFIKRSVTGGFGSKPADIMADTSVALASANVELVSRKVVSRILHMIEKTCMSPTLTLESHLMWNDIAILARYLLMLSFNNSLDVASHLPFLFHIVTLLVGLGPVSMKASTHGLVINIIHSLCTCSQLNFNEDTSRQLRLNLTEFSLPKFYNLFGISKVKSAAVSAFRTSYRPNDRSFMGVSPDDESVPLTSLEVITDALLEIMEAAANTVKGKRDWLQQWMNLAKRFAFQYNPALQPRAIVVYGCISKTISETEIKQLLRILRKALETEGVLIEGVVMCLTRVQPLLKQDSVIHKFLFWVAIAILQLEDQRLYSAALAMLEQNLLTLDAHGVFETQSLRDCMMSTRQQLDWHFRQIDHTMEINFDNNFHFALIAHLIKGFRHPESSTVSRTVRVINTCLCIVSKNLPDKFAVTPETIPYLTALLPVSEEVRTRCHLSPVDLSSQSNLDRLDVFSNPSSHLQFDYHSSSDVSAGVRSLPGATKHWKSLDEVGTGCATYTHTAVTGRSASYNITRTTTEILPPRPPPPRAERSSRTSASVETNVLLDPEALDDELMSLVLTVMATLVGFTTDECEKRVLYQYLAEASIKFPKVFPVVYNLLDHKVIEHLKLSHDQVMLSSVQSIIQNMLTIDLELQQKQFILLQNLGFGGLHRFAGPFKQSNFMGAENLANCLEDMVENYLPGDDRGFDLNNPYPSSLGISASLSLSNLGSPTGSASAAEAAAYRSRHGSQQSRRSSFHKKTRKHSGSFEGIM